MELMPVCFEMNVCLLLIKTIPHAILYWNPYVSVFDVSSCSVTYLCVCERRTEFYHTLIYLSFWICFSVGMSMGMTMTLNPNGVGLDSTLKVVKPPTTTTGPTAPLQPALSNQRTPSDTAASSSTPTTKLEAKQ